MTQAAFEPIAIVGQGCILSGCFTPSGLWRAVRDGRNLLSAPPRGLWGLHPADEAKQPFTAGGFVKGFEKRFRPDDFDLGDVDPASLDPFVQWLLQAGHDAWMDAGGHGRLSGSTAVIVANLAYPSRGLTDYASDLWMEGRTEVQPLRRFSAGYPAMALARSLGASGARFCLDAACASSLYAIKLACDELQGRRADQVVCAAVNGVDNLFLHQGFAALNAISPTGRSRPLVAGADGLVPSEGAAAIILQRLSDVTPDAHVFGVIRGIGLSNDGRRKGLLAPDGDGQAEAMLRAYTSAGLDPASDIGLVECHATGTPVGDGVELRATNRVLASERSTPLPVGSVKSNTGHLITVAGLAGVLKVTGAFEHGVLPPTRLDGEALDLFDALNLVPQDSPTPWPEASPMRAGVSTFGFGGNNAHLILEAPEMGQEQAIYPVKVPDDPVVVCGIGAMAGPDRGIRAIVRRLMRARDEGLRRMEDITVDARAARTPPSDLQRAEAQHLAVLDVAEEALAGVQEVEAERTGCVVAMNCAPDASRWMLRERLANRFDLETGGADRDQALDAIAPEGSAADVLGAMPNMPANRLNVAHDWRGLGFTVAAEQESGAAALRVAITALQRGELDMVIVASAEFAGDSIHEAAISAVSPASKPGGDAAAALVLKRHSRAVSDGDAVLARIDDLPLPNSDSIAPGLLNDNIVRMYGNCHSASALLDLAVRVALESRGLELAGVGVAPRIRPHQPTHRPLRPSGDVVRQGAHMFWCAAATRAALREALEKGDSGGCGPYRIALVSHDRDGLDTRRKTALAFLDSDQDEPSDGVFIGASNKPEGDTAFVFTGSASAYPQAGRGLFMAFPELGSMLAARAPDIHILSPLLSRPELTPFQDLCAGVLTSQAQALLLREWFGLAPEAAIGLSLGETNALIAFGAWSDAETLLDEIAKGEMYERHLGNRFEVLGAAWGESVAPHWENWQVSAPIHLIRELVAGEPHADITIIYSEEACLIGGHPDACNRIASALGPGRAFATGHDFVIHTRFLAPYADTWKAYHTRRTEPVSGVRFYSNGRDTAYQPETQATAEALTRQACNTIDFPATVRRAYVDGVRTFIEIGPRDMLTRSIQKILGDRPHTAVALDRTDRSDILQLTRAMAELFAAGHNVPMTKLAERLDDINASPWPAETTPKTALKVAAHKPPPERPPCPLRKSRSMPREPIDLNAKRRNRSGLDALASGPDQPPVHWPEHLPPGTRQPNEPKPDLPRPSQASDGAASTNCESDLHQAVPTQPTNPGAAPARRQTAAAGTGLGARRKPRPLPLPIVPAQGPIFERDALEAAAKGPISDLFGPLFEPQDQYRRQVRLPAPPLLLVDRISGIDAEPGREGKGIIWTQTDIEAGAWTLHGDCMRPGPLIEAGQADLSLISFMGADFRNQDERVYRLLGCEFTFQNGPMPQPGDRLDYQIEITGHAKSGDVRLFFFQYDCRIGDRLLLSVRNGQAGFFTDDELARSKGILWSAETAKPPTADPAVFKPQAVSSRRRFSADDLDTLRAGDAFACFGAGFEACAPQSRPPRLPGDRLSLIDEVTVFDPDGGPWGRGYLKAEQRVSRKAWFYEGHFHNDPCMPGTLMVEAALQALEVYAMAVGLTLERDSFVFEPAEGCTAKFDCRGQVIPDADHDVTYEVFIDEIVDGDLPVISAALLATCDGQKVFHCDRISLTLKRAWPRLIRSSPPKLIGPDRQARGDHTSLLACADGAPSEAFGAMYDTFDTASRVPRLPQPPFHFMTEVLDVTVPAGQPARGAEATARFDLSDAAWCFADGGTGALPFAALSEIMLQPCGWLASHCGFATDGGAYFRNLDGDLSLHHRIEPELESLIVRTRLDQHSKAGPVIIVRFTVQADAPDGRRLADLDTSFGFFNRDAFAKQAGVPLLTPFDSLLAAPPRNVEHDHPVSGLPTGRLSMIDRMDHFDPDAGSAGLGLARGVQAVDPRAWYFKAHFFQDPVQPGSLGFGALLELLSMASARKLVDGGGPAFEIIAAPCPDVPLRWKCRGQVTPGSGTVSTLVDLTAIEPQRDGQKITANGLLVCDGLPLYSATGLSVLAKSV